MYYFNYVQYVKVCVLAYKAIFQQCASKKNNHLELIETVSYYAYLAFSIHF